LLRGILPQRPDGGGGWCCAPTNNDSGPRGDPFQGAGAGPSCCPASAYTPHLAPEAMVGSTPGRARLRVPPGEVVPIGTPLAAELGGGRVHGGPGPRRGS
jgi:hypothetical protein